MKAFLIITVWLIFLSNGIAAQTASSAAPPKVSNRINDSKADPGGFSSDARYAILQKVTYPIYRPPTKAELAAIAPNERLEQDYAEFLREPNTGLFRLAAQANCDREANVVQATEACLKYTMPGGGSSFSFRTHNYRTGRLADLTFGSNSFFVTGALTHGIIVRIGDLPLEKVTLDTAGLKYLVDFEPTDDFEQAKQIQRRLLRGINTGGFLYASSLPAVDDTTYVLRVVAYRGMSMRRAGGIVFNELDFDKRSDITIAFRIVERAPDGSVTILWRRLSKKASPRVKVKPSEQHKATILAKKTE